MNHKPTRQELEEQNKRLKSDKNWFFGWILFFAFSLIVCIILMTNSQSQNIQLQSQITELKQNGTYNLNVDTTTPTYLCEKYNGTASCGLGYCYCEIIINNVYNRCDIVRTSQGYAFDINPNYNSCNWKEVLPQ